MSSAGAKEPYPVPHSASGQVGFGALREIQEVIDGLVEQIALIGCDGTILAVNDSWRRQVERQARTGLEISRDYVRFLAGLVEDGDEGAAPILQAFREISAGARQTFRCVYHGRGAFAGYDFNIIVAALTVRESRCVLVSVHDVTELVALKRKQRHHGGRLLQAQEAERRRIARELHDSTSQMLVGLELELSRLSLDAGPEVAAVVARCRDAMQEIHAEIRTFSFLAHPPSLVANSLAVALQDLARGFAARTGIEIEVDVSDDGEVSASVEAAIYRLTQEALANIHRHAGASQAKVRLVGRKRYLHLIIHDDGIGFDPAESEQGQSLGVGVIGMRERVRELGGRFLIERADKGTALTVSFPRHKRMVFAARIGRH